MASGVGAGEGGSLIRERLRKADGYFRESGEYVYQPLPLWTLAIPAAFWLAVLVAAGCLLWKWLA